jgi:site-specific DNA recombinase
MFPGTERQIKNVALYTRVSTEEQAQGGFSLDAQLGKLRDYAKWEEWTIIGEYIDGGFTGRNTKRPMYQQMMQDMDKWDAILVMKMDRIHRNQKNFINMLEELYKNGKEFVSAMEKFDSSSAMGRFVMNIMSLIAQLESEQIGERITIAMVQKAKSDKAGFMNHRPPFGYRWDKTLKKHLEVPEELQMVKEIYHLYLDGWSMREIQAKTGIRNSSISYYLHNSFYTGIERWCNFFRKSDLKPIIAIDDFNRVQRRLNERIHGDRGIKPLQIRDESFKINRETEKEIPIIQRGKHNWTRAW